MWRVEQGDCLEVMKGIPDDSVDACIVDPPYGLGTKEPDVARIMLAWASGESARVNDRDFMGKDWSLPGPEYWREVYRVLKPGAHLLCFAGTRTWDLMSIAIRFAGFENRDTIGHNYCLQWNYGSGFPKSHSISKDLDAMAGAKREVVGVDRVKDIRRNVKRDAEMGWDTRQGKYGTGAPSAYIEHQITAPATDEAKQWSGWGTAMKPSWEPILVFRKPLSEPTVAKNVLAYGTGAISIDACRVGTTQTVTQEKKGMYGCGSTEKMRELGFRPYNIDNRHQEEKLNPPGRWPSNLVLSHSPECKRIGEKRVKGAPHLGQKNPDLVKQYGGGIFGGGLVTPNGGYADADGLETVEQWDCVEGCPIAELDRQSNTHGAGAARESGGDYNSKGIFGLGGGTTPRYGDTGGASRFFPNFSWEPDGFTPFLYQAKASKAERRAGLDGQPKRKGFIAGHGNDETDSFTKTHVYERENHHPTVKPIALMRWLCRLVTPPGGTILDCFCGSGTTGCAAVLEGFNFIGIEKDETEGYVDIARARIAYWEKKGIAAKAAPTVRAAEPQPSLFDFDSANLARNED